MFDIGWSEMAIILVVALVVVGPKDLPRLARTLGQWMAKGRSMAREFQRHVDDMAREADLADLKDSVQKISPQGIRNQISKAVDPDGSLAKSLDAKALAKSLDPTSPSLSTPPPAAPATTEPPAAVETELPAAPVAAPVVEPVKTAVAAEPAAPVAGEPVAQPVPAPAEKA